MDQDVSDSEVVDWLDGHSSSTLPALRMQAAAKTPSWRLSEKRLRRLRNLARNVVVVQPVSVEPQSRDAVQSSLKIHHVPGLQTLQGPEALSSFIGDQSPHFHGTLYESNPNTIQWYFEAFSSRAPDDVTCNRLATCIFGVPVYGPLILVKNAPEGTIYNAGMTKLEVAKLLWYYFRSGQSPSEVSSARNFERLITKS
ncbi:hypothetical protein R3P38DRAFT_2776737 [Favolaschia claudopus]|uniref:Uncharacterized protein n=1 Tax=Favolaschia claudopus TaxID=2862362 RepID=A0AAW0BNS3_9AGAR